MSSLQGRSVLSVPNTPTARMAPLSGGDLLTLSVEILFLEFNKDSKDDWKKIRHYESMDT